VVCYGERVVPMSGEDLVSNEQPIIETLVTEVLLTRGQNGGQDHV